MSRMAQPWKHPKTGIYYCRIGIPEDLRPFFGGKREWKYSLKTTELSEARLRFLAKSYEYEQLADTARKQLQGIPQVLPADAPTLADRWAKRVLTEWESNPELLTQYLVVGQDGDVQPLDSFAIYEDSSFTERERVMLPLLREELARQSLPLPLEASPTYQVLIDEFYRKWSVLCSTAQARAYGDWRTSPKLPRAGAPLTRDSRSLKDTSPKLSEVFKAWREQKLLIDKGATKSVSEYEAVVRRFIELHGDTPVSQVTRQACQEFSNALLQLPAKGVGIRSLTVPQAIAKAKAEDLPRISHPSVVKQLRFLSSVLSYALEVMDVIKENPIVASGLITRLKRTSKTSGGRSRADKTYSRHDLREIFSSPLFQGRWQPKTADYGQALYWLPLLASYTGARREELAQLFVSDVRQCPDTSIWFLDIHSEGGNRVKTEGSIRQVPLHSDLLELGFLEYIQSLPTAGRAFPKLKEHKANGYGYAVGDAWGEYLRDVVKLDTAASPFHGFRHTFKTLCREVGIETAVSDWITGHASPNVGATYGVNPLNRMAKEIEKLPSIAREAGLLA